MRHSIRALILCISLFAASSVSASEADEILGQEYDICCICEKDGRESHRNTVRIIVEQTTGTNKEECQAYCKRNGEGYKDHKAGRC